MDIKEISTVRLFSQQIACTEFKTAKEIVGWMGAMQAQDFYMAEWALGVRLPNSTDKLIEEAISGGDIIRTHLMRPTWHFVSSNDIYWMLELTAPRIKASMRYRSRVLGLDEAVYKKSNSIIKKALNGGKHLYREDLIKLLEKSKIATDNNRASHLFFRAELEGILCSGKIIRKKQTYALLNERVPNAKRLNREKALKLLAQKYFTSHCPATLQDFAWWSGLSISDSRLALEMIKPNFINEKIGGQTYWFHNSFTLPRIEKHFAYALPAYDEFVISYKDRSASVPFESNVKTISNNGVFKPLIIINGQVAGIWKRTINKEKIFIHAETVRTLKKSEKLLAEKAFKRFVQFLQKKLAVIQFSR